MKKHEISYQRFGEYSKKQLMLLMAILLILGCTSLETRRYLGVVAYEKKPFQNNPVLRFETGVHHSSITQIDIDEQGAFLVTASLDKTIRVWDMENNSSLANTLRPPIAEGNEGKIYATAISPNGNTIACGGWTGIEWQSYSCIYIWDRERGQVIKRVPRLPNVINRLVYSKFGDYLVAAMGGKNGIRVYRTSDYKLIYEDRSYDDAIYGVDFDIRGKLVVASYDGYIRLYDPKFQLIAKEETFGGKKPFSVSFSPDTFAIAVGYEDSNRVDVLDSINLSLKFSPQLSKNNSGNFACVSWAKDGSLYAAGNSFDADQKCIVNWWDQGGKGSLVEIPVTNNTIVQLLSMPDGSIVFASADPAFGIIEGGDVTVYRGASLLDFREKDNKFKVSQNGHVVQFPYNNNIVGNIQILDSGLALSSEQKMVRSLNESKPLANQAMFPPITSVQSLKVQWRNTSQPSCNGRSINLENGEKSYSIAIFPQRNKFVLGTNLYLRAFDDAGAPLWKKTISSTAWLVNVTRDGKKVITGLEDGTIRWYDAQDGIELLAFFPSVDQKSWFAWSPDGFYDTVSSDDKMFLGWHKNRSLSEEAEFSPVSLERKQATQLAKAFFSQQTLSPSRNTEQEEGTSEVRESIVQTENTTAQGNLYLLAIGVNDYQETELSSLKFAAKDAVDFATSMKKQVSLYSKIHIRSLINTDATRGNILDSLSWLQKNTKQEDTAIVFLAGHGINEQKNYYFLPYGFLQGRLKRTAVSFAAIQRVANDISGKALFFIDTCRSGNAMGKKRIDISQMLGEFSRIQKEVVMIAASTGSQESFENEQIANGVFTKALIEGLAGKASVNQEVTLHSLFSYVSAQVKSMTNSRQIPTIVIPYSLPDFTISAQK